MALVKCKECGAEVSTKAASCPKCGAVRKRQARPTGCLTWVIAIFVVAAVIGGIIESANNPSTPTPSAPTSAVAEKIRREQADSAARTKAELAARTAKFSADRANIIAKAKALLAQRKWNELVDMGNEYAWIPDSELNAIVETARTKVAEIERQKDRARAKHEGVSIGMTKEQVLGSSWGKPQSINSTHTAAGTHEQWVYSGGYLYFDNDVLTAIQN
jgi:hypothetical protein